MKKLTRYLVDQIREDLKEKMVFVSGPRQVGKTTMAKSLFPAAEMGYFNWDIAKDREKILENELPQVPVWILDELHKYRKWRNYLKGLYDAHHDERSILVTGSARLDFFRFGGDSLQGRYHFLRMYPLTVGELKIENQKDFMDLLLLGGFPEPYILQKAVKAKRWSREYRSRLIHEEITSLERIQDLGNVELLCMRLPALVGSPLSINALREDLQVSHKSVDSWLKVLERFYAIFRLSPLGGPKIRAVKKEQKHYHFDWTLVQDKGARFENCVGLHLLKWVHFQEDTLGEDIELRYFRDIDGREVDFVVVKDQKPVIAVECKWSDEAPTKSVFYFKEKYPDCDVYQLSCQGTKDYVTSQNIRVCPALKFLKTLI